MVDRRANLIRRLAELPDEVLDEVEESVDDILRWRQGAYRLSEDERAAVRRGLAAAERGDFVPDAEMADFRRRLR
jgi:predicted transcriptional regulator